MRLNFALLTPNCIPDVPQLARTKVDQDAAQQKLSTIDEIVKERDDMKVQVQNLDAANAESEKEVRECVV